MSTGPVFAHRHDPQRAHYPRGEHVWHYKNTATGASFAIIVLRHLGPGETPYCVCAMDTISNPHAERDADLLCAALNSAVLPDVSLPVTPL